jgi:predicted nuclease of predicted toxin-antitoxin system
LADLFPNSIHVKTIGLNTATDTELWNYARDNDYLIVSKDTDFSKRSAIQGYPPKVIWLRLGNCPTRTVEDMLRSHYLNLETFAKDPNQGLFVLLSSA